ncbi:MAG: hypothetical protein A4E32_00303 [Methanomassiliicoccales archaeon PtaU1.Bin124]|nr:MAG: hypothetical protein A4E32_00303 [Methanomassiliicoccales archaeon PtaU1.Bin124]
MERSSREERTRRLISQGLDPGLVGVPEDEVDEVRECVPQKKKKGRKEYIPCPGKVILNRNGAILSFFEQLYDPISKKSQFAHIHNELVEFVEAVTDPFDETQIYVPLENDLLIKGFVNLASYVKDYPSDLELLEEIKRFLHRYYDTSPANRDVMATYVMLTYICDKLPVMPLINFRGSRDTGKTRGATVLMKVCYRGMRASGAASFASIFREAERWRGTLLINEGDMGKSDETNELIKFLNERYERGGGVWRSTPKTFETEVFNAFGPTIITTRAEIADDALESRCFLILSERTDRVDIQSNLPPSFEEEAAELRAMLMTFRFKWYPLFENDYNLNFKGISTRLNQILQPMASLAKLIDPIFYHKIQSIAETFQQKQIDATSNSEDGLIVRAYFRLEQENAEVAEYNKCREFDEHRERKPINATTISNMIKELGGELAAIRVGKRATALKFSQKPVKINGRSYREYFISTAKHRQQLIRMYLPLEERPMEERGGQMTIEAPPSYFSTEGTDASTVSKE